MAWPLVGCAEAGFGREWGLVDGQGGGMGMRWAAVGLACALSGCAVDKAAQVAMAASGDAASWGTGWSASASGMGEGKVRARARLSPWARGGDGGGHEAVVEKARQWCALMGRGEPRELAYQEGWSAGPLGGAREARGDYACAQAAP